jgi:hypothetical protein
MVMESSMIEKVARAMIEKSNARIAGLSFVTSVDMHGTEDFMALAATAIEAMREPTEEMKRLASEERSFLDLPSYRSLIDAALKQQEEKA